MVNFKYDNFNKYFKIYLLFVLFFTTIQLLFKYEGGTDSTISEWLINYQGGFVRRGLLGELFFQISVKLNIEIRVIIVIFKFLFTQSISYCFIFFEKYKKKFCNSFCNFFTFFNNLSFSRNRNSCQKRSFNIYSFLDFINFPGTNTI